MIVHQPDGLTAADLSELASMMIFYLGAVVFAVILLAFGIFIFCKLRERFQRR